jgi:hypothetical protein
MWARNPALLLLGRIQREPPRAPSVELMGLDHLTLDQEIHDVPTECRPMGELFYRELVRPLEAG